MAVELIGASRAFRGLLDTIAMIAHVDTSVLLMGETGTGKEVVARAIHHAGLRRTHRFVAVNCAAIPAGLLESELFGHERGAFTGAKDRTAGRLEVANRGTLFLDEIGDLPLELQPKLLRALQEREIERLGSGGRAVPIDVRVVAATNQNIGEMVQRREFRADLYYRLNVFPITLPPLRDRTEDIALLTRHFVSRFAERHRKDIRVIPDDVLDALTQMPWPGNVRELQNVVERAVIATRGNTLTLPNGIDVHDVSRPAPSRTLADVERHHIIETLRETNWVVGGWNGAAVRLGLSRTTLIARMQRLGISKESTFWNGERRGPRRSRTLTEIGHHRAHEEGIRCQEGQATD
jgi:transcriptional regulator with GAF, ATPase, and Fis domain